jgi:hypothetical protein
MPNADIYDDISVLWQVDDIDISAEDWPVSIALFGRRI